MILSDRFEAALVYALRLHADQRRKGSGTPYAAHLLGTAALVLEYGGDEEQAIAALLHDAVEDQGGQAQLQEITRRFGERVARIVAGCSDSFEQPKPPWRQRKEGYLAHLPAAHPDVLLVSCADKLHNARAIVRDLRIHGETVWERFTGGKVGTLWYYRALAEAFGRVGGVAPADELAAAVREMEALQAV